MENLNRENLENNNVSLTDVENSDCSQEFEQNAKRGFFDVIADFFKLMVKGILKFTFIRIPKFIFKLFDIDNLKAAIKFLYRMWRAVFWCTLWLAIVFAAWIAFGLKQFIGFWSRIGDHIWNILCIFGNIIVANAGPIWFVIAIIGSIYGLAYRTLKKRAKKKGVPFRGVFGFLRRKKAIPENIQE